MNRVAVVTGSNKGIGFHTVQALCKSFTGDVFLTARDDEKGNAAVKLLQEKGFNPKFHQLDITCTSSVKDLRREMESKYGGIDVLINNAGVKLADPTPLGVQAKVMFETNYFGTQQTCDLLLPIIKDHGRVINVAGMIAPMSLRECSKEMQKIFRSDTMTMDELNALMNHYIARAQIGDLVEKGYSKSPYGMSKIGVTVMSRIQARRLRQEGRNNILLNACCPGWCRTDMAGPKAPLSAEQGSVTPTYLATLPEGATEPHGQYVASRRVKRW